jgi:sugar O-acyltransferase (sialic acid O-acetyltransferase NeuD family)
VELTTSNGRPQVRIVILGSGGHARASLEVLRESPEVEICGCLAPDGTDVAGVPVIGSDSSLAQMAGEGIEGAFVAVGKNELRKQLMEKVLACGLRLITTVSQSARVAPDVHLGAGTIVMPGAILRTGAVVGDGVIINSGAIVDHDARIGSWSHIGPGAALAGGVTLMEGAFLGVGCKVIPDVTIGAWSIVGAGSVALRNIPSGVTAVGSPARIIRSCLQ